MAEQLGKVHAYDLDGIFRQTAATHEKQVCLDQINQGHYEIIQKMEDGYLIADVMKRLFFLMDEPFIPYPLYKEIIQQGEYTEEYCRSILAQLSPTRQAMMHFLTDLTAVCLRHPSNQMSVLGFAICWAPSLMRTYVNYVGLKSNERT